MAKLTAQQANELANNFLGLAQAVGDYRFANWNQLSKKQKMELGDQHEAILKATGEIFALSTTLIMNEVQASLNKISTITKEIKDDIGKIANIQKAINVATAVVTLASAIISEDVGGIGAGIGGLVSAWKA